jgi:phenylalanyl-tRNA synthetase alpha chain
VVEEQIQQLQAAALQRIEEAKDLDALEQVRVDVLGRKGSLAQFNVGQAAAGGAKGKAGKALNAAKQELDGAFETNSRHLRRRR